MLINTIILMQIKLLATLMIIPTMATAQDTDTIAGKMLGEVVVEAKNATPVADGIEFRPSQREKKTSLDYFGLLEKMQIPVLKVNPSSREIKTNTGREVAYFINGREASAMEVNGLRPKDVLKVAVLRSPSDPKYMGRDAVIDFIIKEYEWGGYTSANATQSFILNEGEYTAYSKFVTGRHTLQASGGASYRRKSSDHSIEHSEMDMVGSDGEPWKLISDSRTNQDRFRQLDYFGGIKWSYEKQGSYLLTLAAGIRSFNVPDEATTGSVKYNVDDYESYTTSSSQSYCSASPYIGFSARIHLSERLQLLANIVPSASLNSTDYRYSASNLPAPLTNHTKETVFGAYLFASITYSLPNNSSLGVSVSEEPMAYNTRYTNTTASRQKLLTNSFTAHLVYSTPIGTGWSARISAGLPINYMKANSEKPMTDIMGSGNISINGSIGTDHSLYFNASLERMGRVIQSYNDASYQTSEYEAKSGNMSLGLTPVAHASLSYTWMPTNNFSLSFSTMWNHRWNDFVIGYLPHNGIMHNAFVNSGQYDELSFNLDAPIRLFSRKLSITPGVGIARVFHSGIYHVDKWGISPSLSVSYIPTEKLSFSLYASTSQFTTIYAKGSGETSRHHTPFFHLSGSYTAGDFGCSLSIAPFYRYSKSSQTLNGPNINRSRTDWEVAGGRRIAVSLTYNIGYGRQVSRGNENIVNSLRSSSVR